MDDVQPAPDSHGHGHAPPKPHSPVPIQLDIANRSTVLTDAQVEAFAQAFQVQVSRDFAPLWGVDALVHFVPKHGKHDPKNWWLVFLDDADQAGALGYHDVTSSHLPIGKAFARTAQEAGDSWTVTGSHEGLEMLGDPHCDATTHPVPCPAAWGDFGMVSVILEDADAVEADTLGYAIDGLLMSDFVTRAWFDPHAAAGTLFDFKGHCSSPLEVLGEGYISFRLQDGQWQQYFNQGTASRARFKHAAGPAPHSRLERLLRPRYTWVPSTAV